MDEQDRTMMVPSVDANATVMGASVTCPICKTENAPTEKYCGDCGFLLSSTPVEDAVVPDASSLAKLTDASGREYMLAEGENSVGREAATVLLADPTVSRSHAKLTIEGGKAWLEDMGSSNGTSASGVMVRPGDKIEVADGAELKFGSALLKLVLPAAAAVAEPFDEPVEAAEVVDEQTDEPEAETAEAEEVALEPLVPVAKLISTKDMSVEYLVMPGSNTLGRRSANSIVLDDDPYVSGAHAEIIADDQGIWLTDVGSTNGTSLNGALLEPNVRMALKTGDDIVFGQTPVKLQIAESPAGE